MCGVWWVGREGCLEHDGLVGRDVGNMVEIWSGMEGCGNMVVW